MADGKKKEQLRIPLKWVIPDGIEPKYPTNIVIQHSEHEYFINFFTIKSPLLVGTPEEIKAKVSELEYVEAECIARLVVSPGRLVEFAKVLNRVIKEEGIEEESSGNQQ